VACLVEQADDGEEPRATGSRDTRKDGDTIWCEWYHSACSTTRQDVSICLRAGRSSRIQAESAAYMATRDALTGLPIALLLHER
jgi:hypothetical protein